MLQDFEYVSPKTIEEVVTLLTERNGQARILCGGTDLLVQLREGRRKAALIIDIKRIPEANQLSYDPESGLCLGAAVSCSRFCSDPLALSGYPGLVDAISLIGGVQVQGRASVGGNLCNASPAADAIPALIVHSAVAVTAGPQGSRVIPVESFCTGPGQNALLPGECLVYLRVPPPGPRFGAHYLRFIPRNEMDIAVTGAGASICLSDDGSRIAAARVALAAVAPTPLYVREAGEVLAGKEITSESFKMAIAEAAHLAQEATQPIDDLRGSAAQRRHLAGVLTRRALEKALDRARG